jgi:hypothetical protein
MSSAAVPTARGQCQVGDGASVRRRVQRCTPHLSRVTAARKPQADGLRCRTRCAPVHWKVCCTCDVFRSMMRLVLLPMLPDSQCQVCAKVTIAHCVRRPTQLPDLEVEPGRSTCPVRQLDCLPLIEPTQAAGWGPCCLSLGTAALSAAQALPGRGCCLTSAGQNMSQKHQNFAISDDGETFAQQAIFICPPGGTQSPGCAAHPASGVGQGRRLQGQMQAAPAGAAPP